MTTLALKDDAAARRAPALVLAFFSEGQTADARGGDLPPKAYRDAILAACGHGKVPRDAALDADDVLRIARDAGVDVGQRAVDSLVAALADCGDWRRGARVALDRRTKSLRPPSVDAQARVVRAAEQAGHWRSALRLMDDMRKDDVVFYDNPIFDSLFKTGVLVWNAGVGDDAQVVDDPDDHQ